MQNFGGVVRLLPNQVVLIRACGLEVLKTFLVRQLLMQLMAPGQHLAELYWFKLSDPSSGGQLLNECWQQLYPEVGIQWIGFETMPILG